MVAKAFIPFKGINNIKALTLEKQLLERNYSFLKVKIVGQVLICDGICQPSIESVLYSYRLKFEIGKHPKVYIMNPSVQYDNDIHMYNDESLCLYYPKDFSFTSDSHLYNTIIPWTHEWFIFYELYLITGKWLHPYVKHKKI